MLERSDGTISLEFREVDLMYVAGLECTQCGKMWTSFDAQERNLTCKNCGSLLDVKYNYARASRSLNKENLAKRDHSIWRYRELLPIRRAENIISLGEGWTPIQRSGDYGRRFGFEHLYLKLDYLNPTGSFKDRGSTVLVSKARELGVESIIDDSSGNAGSSIAAYCAKAGILCSIYVPASAPPEKTLQVEMYGARIVRINGTREEVVKAAKEACKIGGEYYAWHGANPYFLEGNKTFAYEVAEQMNWEVPDHIIFPVGGGSLLLGAWKGFGELLKLDLVDRIPRLHCVQSQACMPIVHAHRSGLNHVDKVREGKTVAGGVRIGRPVRGAQVLEAIRASGGTALAVSDEEVLYHHRVLAGKEGLFAEPTSCVALAGLSRLCESKEIGCNEVVVVPITGFGLKDTETASKQVALGGSDGQPYR